MCLFYLSRKYCTCRHVLGIQMPGPFLIEACSSCPISCFALLLLLRRSRLCHASVFVKPSSGLRRSRLLLLLCLIEIFGSCTFSSFSLAAFGLQPRSSAYDLRPSAFSLRPHPVRGLQAPSTDQVPGLGSPSAPSTSPPAPCSPVPPPASSLQASPFTKKRNLLLPPVLLVLPPANYFQVSPFAKKRDVFLSFLFLLFPLQPVLSINMLQAAVSKPHCETRKALLTFSDYEVLKKKAHFSKICEIFWFLPFKKMEPGICDLEPN